jgi:hypothetical protein
MGYDDLETKEQLAVSWKAEQLVEEVAQKVRQALRDAIASDPARCAEASADYKSFHDEPIRKVADSRVLSHKERIDALCRFESVMQERLEHVRLVKAHMQAQK